MDTQQELELPLNVPLQPNEIYVIEWRRVEHAWGVQSKPSSFSPDGYADCFVKDIRYYPGWQIWTTTRSEETLADLKAKIREMEAVQNFERPDVEANPKEGAVFKQELQTRITKIHYTA
jgi:hypothetical protein